jgi:iron complex outermembrane receptor protein
MCHLGDLVIVPINCFNRRRLAATLATLLWWGRLATVVNGQTATEDLKRMTLEEMMGIEVSTVTRSPEPTTSVPAAVHVITQDDIRRSGARSLPEVLRTAPGLQVARLDSARYAIGSRGFADRLARSMLVLIDGRAVYSPLFAGTYWESQNTLLEDIERIEIIRGPGGTLWGANAVNGIVNIVTKRAADTQGGLLTAAAGSEPRGMAGVRYGGRVGSNFHFRAYAQGFDRRAQLAADYDGWNALQAGARGDWSLPGARALTVQGEAYGISLGQRAAVPLDAPPYSQTITREAPLDGGHVLARWSGAAGPRGEFQLQSYFDRTHRDEVPVAETRHTFEVDFQYKRRIRARHDVVAGAAVRVTSNRLVTVAPTAFDPPGRTDKLFSAFLQDDVALVPDRLRLVVGTKVEHNDYSGYEIQPSARMVWTLNASNTVVWSATRAVRTPSAVEVNYTTSSLVSAAVPSFVRLQPYPSFRPEELVAYEVGYRVRPASRLYVTASAFFNELNHLVSTELLSSFVDATTTPPRLILPVTFANGLHGNSHGLEVTGDLRVTPWWRWTAHYSFLRVQVTKIPGGNDVTQERRYEGITPQHQVQVQSSLDLPGRLSVDWFARRATALPAGPVPAYTTSTVRLAWQVRPTVEIALVGQDLHSARHLEWPGGAQVKRSGYVGLTIRP